MYSEMVMVVIGWSPLVPRLNTCATTILLHGAFFSPCPKQRDVDAGGSERLGGGDARDLVSARERLGGRQAAAAHGAVGAGDNGVLVAVDGHQLRSGGARGAQHRRLLSRPLGG